MLYFDHDNTRYHIRHHLDDDSRTVVACEDWDFKVLLKFDSSLNVWAGNGLKVGHLTSRDDGWTLVKRDGSEVNLGVTVRDYHWNHILKAEAEAAKVLLSDMAAEPA